MERSSHLQWMEVHDTKTSVNVHGGCKDSVEGVWLTGCVGVFCAVWQVRSERPNDPSPVWLHGEIHAQGAEAVCSQETSLWQVHLRPTLPGHLPLLRGQDGGRRDNDVFTQPSLCWCLVQDSLDVRQIWTVAMRGVTVSTSAFLACIGAWCNG